MKDVSQVLAEDTQWQLGNDNVHCTCSTLKGCAHLHLGKFKHQIVEVTGHAEVSSSPLRGVMWDHTHQPTFTMVESTCERKHGFWRTPRNTRCSSGLCRTSQFWMDWVLVHLHQWWRWEQLPNSSFCIQLTCYYGISHIKLDRLHFLILFRAGHEYLTLVPIQESNWRKMINWGQIRGLGQLNYLMEGLWWWEDGGKGQYGGCINLEMREREGGREGGWSCYLSQAHNPVKGILFVWLISNQIWDT